jgi:DMSO/TMAO reductase YedYZ molybdopterin-dependent catalytic subunit
MRKISRRLFLLLLLSACAPFNSRLLPGPNETSPTGLPPNDLTPVGQIPIAQIPSFVPVPTVLAPTQTLELTPETDSGPQINEVVFDSDTSCRLPITAPTLPAVIPAISQIDANTGRHMMGTVQVLDLASYRLEITGLVDHPLKLTLDDLLCLPKMTETVTTTCYSFQDSATWSGVLISDVLKKAGVQPGAQKVILTGADGAVRTVPMDMAMDPHNFLAYQMGENPLPILFGFPVRSIFINVAGQYSVKWLTSLEIA